MKLHELQNLIDKAAQAYYRDGSSSAIMTDAQYDDLIVKLRKLDPNDERLNRVGVVYTAEELRNKVIHPFPMGSLDNTDDGILGLESWHEKVSQKLVGKTSAELVVSHKVDGSSVRARYEQGRLVQVVTRGNGDVGEDITANGASFLGLPTVLPEPLDIDVRGEAVLLKEDHRQIMQKKTGFANYFDIPVDQRSNPRNVGNGILSRDSGEDANKIRFMAFDVWASEKRFGSLSDKLNFLAECDFRTVPHEVLTVDEITNYYNDVVAGRDDLAYEIDGLVVCLNQLDAQDKFVTSDIKTRMRPKYARAIKFPHQSAITTLVDVEVSIGHTGAIVPTALLEEVRIGGVNVTHALLNNYEEIERLELAVGDEVEVILAGDIIPKIIRKHKSSGNPDVEQPKRCPCCGEVATKRAVGNRLSAVLYCSQPSKCPEVRLQKVKRWIGGSKKGVGILGIGDAILRALWDHKLVSDPADLYTLTASDIENLQVNSGVLGHSRATEIVNNIQGKKDLKLSDFLGSLGIDLLGRRRVDQLRKKAYGKLDVLEDWLNDENWINPAEHIRAKGLSIEGMGDSIRQSIRDGINENRDLINKLLQNGVTVTDGKQVEVGKNVLDGVSFCFTGTRECILQVEMLGAEIKNSVAKSKPSPDFLVQKDPLSTSGKTKNAEANGHTKVISLDYLKKCIQTKDLAFFAK